MTIKDETEWKNSVRRAEALKDSRKLNWNRVDRLPPPPDKTIYIATRGPDREWIVLRVNSGNMLPMPPGAGVWWAPDLLGLPFDGQPC